MIARGEPPVQPNRRRRRRLDPLSHRLLKSPLGWILPGGFDYKLGRLDRGQRGRAWPYLLNGPLGGFFYNAGREDAAALRYVQRCRRLTDAVQSDVPSADLAEAETLFATPEPYKGVQVIAWSLSRNRIDVTPRVVDEIKGLSSGYFVRTEMPTDLDSLAVRSGEQDL